MLCDSCVKDTRGNHDYVGCGMVLCQACIAEQLIRTPKGYRWNPGYVASEKMNAELQRREP